MTPKQFYRERLLATGRKGAAELYEMLVNYHFFGARCGRHHAWRGGTAQHSIEALLYAEKHNRWGIPQDSLTIVCLLHDLCNLPAMPDFCHGAHGYRSAELARTMAGLEMTDEEYDAICHHMHGHRNIRRFRGRAHEVMALPCWQMIRSSDRHSASEPMTQSDFLSMLEQQPEKTNQPTA